MIRWIILAKEPDCRAGVVLPDDSTGQGPGTLAGKLSRCKEGMARVFAVMVQSLLRAGAPAPCERSE
jgi:hypothetical protein